MENPLIFAVQFHNALVAELVDALDSKSSSFGSAGSIPALGTKALFFSCWKNSLQRHETTVVVGLSGGVDSSSLRIGSLFSGDLATNAQQADQNIYLVVFVFT